MGEDVKAVLNFFESSKKEREAWDPLFQEAANFLLPRKAAFTANIVKGENRHDYLYDDTGPWALEQFTNGLHSYMTNPLARWFDLQIRDRELKDNDEVKAWKDIAVNVLYDQFNSSVSSFHPVIHETYSDIGAFGYGVAYSEWSEEDNAVLFQSRFPGECYLIEDMYGRIRGVNRKYKLTATQFVEAFGVGSLPKEEQTKYNQANLRKDYEIVHIVLPVNHPIMKRFKIPSRYKFGSVRVCTEQKDQPLAVGGFRSFPYHVARWGKRAGEVYSTSPGINALPSIRRANAIQLDLVKIANRWADPPTQGPDDEALAPYDLSPGAQNYYRPGTNDRIEGIANVLGDPSWAEKVLANTSQSILRMFFVEAFLTTADSNGQNVKAAFVHQRKDEQFRQLSAMLSRTERELLGSLIERVFDICQDKGLIPPAPFDVTIEIDYLSPIVRAQRAEQLDGLYPLVELSSLAAQYDPTVMGSYRWDNIIRDAGSDIYALPPSWFKTAAEVEQEKLNAAAQQEAAAAAQIAQGLGGAIKDVADADLAQRQQ